MTADTPFPLPVTAWAITTFLSPHEWLTVADYLTGQIERAPLTGAGWQAHRIVLGALASELRDNALAAGEPVIEDPQEDLLAEHHIEGVVQAFVASGHARDEAFLRDAAHARLDAMYEETKPPPTEPVAADITWFD